MGSPLLDLCPRRATFRSAVTVVLIAVLVSLTASPAVAADEDVTVEPIPSTVVVQAGQTRLLDVVIRNPGKETVTVTSLGVTGMPEVSGKAESAAFPATLTPNTAVRGVIELTVGSGVAEGSLGIIAEVQTSSAGTRYATSSLTVKVAGTTDPELVFEVFPEKLNDGQHRAAVVRVSNRSGMALSAVVISAIDSDDVAIRLPSQPVAPFIACPEDSLADGPTIVLACLDELPPGGTHLVEVQVRAHEHVRTGKQSVGILLAGVWGGPAAEGLPPVRVVATQAVELGVFGVDALSPFGIGALFLLPGLVAGVVALVGARYVYPKSPALPDTVELKDLRVLPIIVPFAALVYLLVWFLWGRDLTTSLGTLDVALLFGCGLLLGLLVWGVIALSWWWLSGRKVFNPADGCAKVLKRLQARNAGLMLPQFTADGMTYFYLGPAAGGKFVACPPMEYAFATSVKADDRVRESFRASIESDDLASLRKTVRRGLVTLKWSAAAGVRVFDAVNAPANGRLLGEAQHAG